MFSLFKYFVGDADSPLELSRYSYIDVTILREYPIIRSNIIYRWTCTALWAAHQQETSTQGLKPFSRRETNPAQP